MNNDPLQQRGAGHTGASDRSRTCDRLITSQLLYQTELLKHINKLSFGTAILIFNQILLPTELLKRLINILLFGFGND